LNSRLHDLNHLLSDSFLMRVLSVTGCLNLLSSFLSESEREKSKSVSVSCFALNEGFDQRMPFLDHRACLISGNAHSVEVGVTFVILDFHDLELELSPGLCLRLVVAVSQGDIENTTSQAVSGILLTGTLVTWGQSDLSLIETWGKYVVPLFSGEWVDNSLFSALLFEVSWVFTCSHWISSGFYKGGIPSLK